MNCNENTIPTALWSLIKKIPAIRYMKAPVFNVHQLYERYVDGLEFGSFAFVIRKFCFYGWDFKTKEWKKIGLALDDLTWDNILDKPDILTIDDLINYGFITDAPKDGKSYIRNNGEWIMGVEEAPDDGQKYCRQNEQWVVCDCEAAPPPEPEVEMIVSPQTIIFNPESDSQAVSVIITGATDSTFIVSGLPSWASVSNQNETGFILSVNDNSISESNKDFTVTVTSNANPTISQTIQVTQYGAFLSDFEFDVNIPAVASDGVTAVAGTEIRIFNLGCSVGGGQARIWWGDGNIEDITNVPVSQIQVAQDPAGGSATNTMNILIGTDYTHTYAQAGTYPVIVKTRNGVDSFRFTTLDSTANNEWYSSGDMNNYVTNIKKIQSDYIVNASRMFAGVRYGAFDPSFVLQTPNVTIVDYMFEFFGVQDFTYGQSDAAVLAWSLLLPPNIFSLFTTKSQITKCTRMYNGSGFLKIQRCMLSFSTALTSVLETFRGMSFVGNNWSKRTGATVGDVPIIEEFLETDLFQDNLNINDFRGCFFWINDWYDNYTDTGYIYPLTIRADLFKNNVAQNIDLSWMFRQSNRSILEVDLFRYIKDRLVKLNGMFWGAWNYGGSPVVGVNGNLLVPASVWNNAPADNPTWAVSPFNLDYRGASDLNLLFPDASYPSIKEAVYLFGWRSGTVGTDTNGTNTTPAEVKRGTMNGAHLLMSAYGNPGRWNVQWRYDEYNSNWTGIEQDQINIADFLLKFPNATSTSGKKPSDGSACDAFYGAFWDFDVIDNPTSNLSRASDYNNVSGRNDVFLEANEVGWGWGTSV